VTGRLFQDVFDLEQTLQVFNVDFKISLEDLDVALTNVAIPDPVSIEKTKNPGMLLRYHVNNLFDVLHM
jgi:hypothetical protein